MKPDDIREDIETAAKGKTDKEAWADVLSTLRAANLTSQQRFEIMRRVAIWGAVCVMDAGNNFVKDTREVLEGLVKGSPS